MSRPKSLPRVTFLMNMPSSYGPVYQSFRPVLSAVSHYPLMGCASLDRDAHPRTFGIELWLFLLVLLELNGSDTQRKKSDTKKPYWIPKKNNNKKKNLTVKLNGAKRVDASV